MRRRIPFVVTLLLIIALQAAIPLRGRSAPNLQTSTPVVTVTELGKGEAIQLYHFQFDPGAAIDRQRIVEPMLVSVLRGSFVFYLPPANPEQSQTIYTYGEEPPTVVETTNGCSLPPTVEQPDCTFTDTEVTDPSFTCTQDPNDSRHFGCTASASVGIKVEPGMTLVLPGPTECFICALDEAVGADGFSDLEVAVAAPPETFEWLKSPSISTPSAQAPGTETVVLHVNLNGVDPCGGRTG